MQSTPHSDASDRRPRQVIYAVRLLWGTLYTGVLRLIAIYPLLSRTAAVWTTMMVIAFVLLVLAALYWWILGSLSRGRNWARITLLGLFLLWLLVGYGQVKVAFSRSSLEGGILVLQQALYVVALILVFTPTSNAWFRGHRHDSPAGA